MEIIKATSQHLESLLEFARENFLLTYGHLNSEENMQDYLESTFSLNAFTREFNHTQSNFFIVWHNETISGYYKSNMGKAQTESDYPDSLEIERIYVTEKLKGQGIGRKMIDHAIKYAKTLHLESIWLGVWEHNPKAIAFYKKMGFQQVNTHTFQLGDDAQTDLIMQLEL